MKRLATTTLAACLATYGCTAPTPPPAATAASPPTSAAPYVKNPRYWPTPVMDHHPPALPTLTQAHAVLVFSKTNGFRDDEQIKAADAALLHRVRQKGWEVFSTENAAVFNPEQLAKFDVVVLNSISGNVFLAEQRDAFRTWLEKGGGVLALHGSGGDHTYDWRWYVDVMLGAQFIGHTSTPNQFQPAAIQVVDRQHSAMKDLPAKWQRTDEWYAFDRVPSGYHTHVLAVLDEKSYTPAPEQVMGYHPIIWTRCIGQGRVFFSALGHKAETYSETEHMQMVSNALEWASLARQNGCD